MTVSDTLNERAKTYGDFRDIARISGALQKTMRAARNWDGLPDDMREALQTIASKIARILNGDCEHIDSWHDIAGYAVLVENRLREADAKVPITCAPPNTNVAPPGAGAAYAQEAQKRADESAVPPAGVDVWYSTDQGADRPWYAVGPKGNARAATRDAAVAAVQ